MAILEAINIALQMAKAIAKPNAKPANKQKQVSLAKDILKWAKKIYIVFDFCCIFGFFQKNK